MKLLNSNAISIIPSVDTDSLSFITSIFTRRQLRDRFDVLNKYSNIRWASGSDPVPDADFNPDGRTS